MKITFEVYGQPAPQGSKRHVGGGRMIESSKAVAPWREAVKWAAIEAMTQRVTTAIQSVLGIAAKVKLVEPKSIERFEGKAKRVIDKRTQVKF